MNKAIQTSFERIEKKYFLTPHQAERFQAGFRSFVKPDDYPTYTLCNVYYDTDDFRLIRASLEKPVYKEKLRVRSYGVPAQEDKVFVELKKKFDGIVYKRRITATPFQADSLLNGQKTQQRDQITREIEYFQRFYQTKPKVFIAYDREAYQGLEDPELRITFDTNLRYRLDALSLSAGDHGAPILDGDLTLMEIKIPGVCPLWLSRLLNELQIFPTSFSKYGTCYQQHILKNNQTIFTKEARYSA